MTEQRLIAEFILQGIKENDLVEIELGRNNFIKGYVVDKDVFQPDSLQQELRRKLYGIDSGNKKKLRIMQVKEDNEIEQKLKESLIINFNYLPRFPKDIYPEQIVAIKKL